MFDYFDFFFNHVGKVIGSLCLMFHSLWSPSGNPQEPPRSSPIDCETVFISHFHQFPTLPTLVLYLDVLEVSNTNWA